MAWYFEGTSKAHAVTSTTWSVAKRSKTAATRHIFITELLPGIVELAKHRWDGRSRPQRYELAYTLNFLPRMFIEPNTDFVEFDLPKLINPDIVLAKKDALLREMIKVSADRKSVV